MSMMSRSGFKKYYLATTRAGSEADLRCFFQAWFTVHSGTPFEGSNPNGETNPKYKMPEVCNRVKTQMLSDGASAATAKRVIDSFKKWFKETY